MPALLIFKNIFLFFLKRWKVFLPLLVVVAIGYVIYSQKMEIVDLTQSVAATQQELSTIKDLYATQQEINALREQISTNNRKVEVALRERQDAYTASMRDLEAKVKATGTERERTTMELNKDVVSHLDKALCDGGYKDCEQ